MMVATVPIIAPIMFKAGFDPVWFGILIIILMETGDDHAAGRASTSTWCRACASAAGSTT